MVLLTKLHAFLRHLQLSILLPLALLSALGHHGAHAQVGVSLCACQPSVWNIELDFDNTCEEDEKFTVGPGIAQVNCQENLSGSAGDTVFVGEVVIAVSEFDQGFTQIGSSTIVTGKSGGDTFTYNSVLASTSTFSTSSLPKAISFSITGKNEENTALTVSWSITFTNDCNTFPVVALGDKWHSSTVTSTTGPPQNVCPLAGSPSEMPSASMQPSQLPSLMPSDTIQPSETPRESNAPSEQPSSSVQPSGTPTESMVPSERPSLSVVPSETPSESNSPSHTPSLSAQPSDTPSESIQPTNMPSGSMQPSDMPSDMPSQCINRKSRKTKSPDASMSMTKSPGVFIMSMTKAPFKCESLPPGKSTKKESSKN